MERIGIGLSQSVQEIVDDIIRQAVKQKASDIHIEPVDEGVRIRYRLDGVLCQRQLLPKSLLPKLSARIKVMSHLDIANSRLPMDGRCSWQDFEQAFDLRISTMPTVRGEKIVIRLLESRRNPASLDELIPYDSSRTLLRNLIRHSQGLFVICGPTGSGKTTTLYAALNELDSPEISIATLEDPVEMRIDGFCQSQVHEKAGLGFQNGLRALLRQDPDILVIGEIRDRETAEIAIQAALTGHRVFSTLHTSRAVDVPLRLIDMGLEPYLIAEALLGMASQRLVRRGSLGKGYQGRFCLCEVVPAGPLVSQAIHDQAGRTALLKAAAGDHAVLMENCIHDAIKAGLTDWEEVNRVYKE